MQVTTDKLMKDLRAVVVDTEDLIKATAGQTGERIEEVRARAEESVRNARARVTEVGSDLSAKVKDHPWTAVSVAAGVGLVLGVLIARR